MAANNNNLAVVGDTFITVYSDPLHGQGSVLAQIPLPPGRGTHTIYADALRAAGWTVSGLWAWASTSDGARPSVAVRQL